MKRKAYKTATRVQLQDECPRIGSGMRFVNAQVGRKWVKLVNGSQRRDWENHCCRMGKPYLGLTAALSGA